MPYRLSHTEALGLWPYVSDTQNTPPIPLQCSTLALTPNVWRKCLNIGPYIVMVKVCEGLMFQDKDILYMKGFFATLYVCTVYITASYSWGIRMAASHLEMQFPKIICFYEASSAPGHFRTVSNISNTTD